MCDGVRRRLPRRAAARHPIREQADSGKPTVVADPDGRGRRRSTATSRARSRSRDRARRRAGPARARRSPRSSVAEHAEPSRRMSIKSDNWIRRMAQEHGMIEPFEPGQVKRGRRPAHRVLRHLELRLRHPLRRRIQALHQHQQHHRRPEEFRRRSPSSTSRATSASSRRTRSRWRARSNTSASRATC